jgi:hypothetical protein
VPKLNSKVTSERLMRLIWDPGNLDDSGSVGCDTAQRCGLMSRRQPIYQKDQTTSNRRESFRRIEQEQSFIVYLPTSVQVSQPSAVVASLSLSDPCYSLSKFPLILQKLYPILLYL